MANTLKDAVNRFIDYVAGVNNKTPTEAEFEDVPTAPTPGTALSSSHPSIGADELALALLKQTEAKYAKPPSWVADLQKDLREAIGTIENATLDSGERAATRRYMEEVRQRSKDTTEAFEKLQRFVETGRACPDCRESRKEFVRKLTGTLEEAQRGGPPNNTGDTYATRQHAFQAGYFICAQMLLNTVAAMQGEYFDGKKV